MLNKFCYPEPGAGTVAGAGQDWPGSTTLFLSVWIKKTRRHPPSQHPMVLKAPELDVVDIEDEVLDKAGHLRVILQVLHRPTTEIRIKKLIYKKINTFSQCFGSARYLKTLTHLLKKNIKIPGI